MNALPSGTVTFLFTDIEGSTRLFQQHPDAMKVAIARHHALLEHAIGTNRRPRVPRRRRRLLLGVRGCGRRARAALDAQRALHRESWGEAGPIRVRMGLHTGKAEAHDGDYVASLTLARTQRVAAAGHGGQTLLSAAAAGRVRATLAEGDHTARPRGAQAPRSHRAGDIHPARRRRPAFGVSSVAGRGRRRIVGSAVAAIGARPSRRSRMRRQNSAAALGQSRSRRAAILCCSPASRAWARRDWRRT